ncbi:transketolase [Clostridium fallax]|uniref:Transketolase n=1 Tax=Clostridium fallax TaxID=1533 RepID=A0A1M4YCU6_9CLOT|nr:transketolase [Clostridium fallax]SHF03342.1 transketolase [Clostridium fallax]SQB05863.1 transketolase, beta subunit [Clostridium fallax]
MRREEEKFLAEKCNKIRRLILEEIHSVGKGHYGGSLSIVEVLTLLYNKEMNIDPKNSKKENRDRLVLSKGHAGPALYAVLADKGYIEEKDLLTLNKENTLLPSHCDMNRTNGVDMTTGSLGQGISCAVGMAKASKIKKDNAYIYCIVGDGECNEGQVWEAALAAPQFKLNNLILFVDYNKLQLDGEAKDIINMDPMADKWKAFGWYVLEVDGHNLVEIHEAIEKGKNQDKPIAIILDTKKGKGVSPIEKAGYKCHSMGLTEEEFKNAIEELR